jgi:hypothetical protein
MQLNQHEKLVQFVLEQSAEQPLSRRISLYRSLAEIVGNQKDTLRLKRLAEELERADKRCAEFTFQFGVKGGRNS